MVCSVQNQSSLWPMYGFIGWRFVLGSASSVVQLVEQLIAQGGHSKPKVMGSVPWEHTDWSKCESVLYIALDKCM